MTPVAASSPLTVLKVEQVFRDARTLLGAGVAPAPPVTDGDARHALSAVARAALDHLDAGGCEDPGRRDAVVLLGVRAQDLLREWDDEASAHRSRLLAEVQGGLNRLSRMGPSSDLLDRVCQEVVRSCGLRRAVLSRVEGSTWYPWAASFVDDREGERDFVRFIRGITIDLSEAPIERLVVEEGRPRLVQDAAGPRAYGPMIRESGCTSYVVVPITPAGRVVGFLHADNHPDTTPVDAIDRDVLWAFAEGFGRVYERAELHERLRAQRGRVHATFEVVEQITDAIDEQPVELLLGADERLSAEGGAARTPPFCELVDRLLTPRERDVVALMTKGLGNPAIAEELVITDGTVKSHVKSILRKLQATNRAEVIARSMGMADR